MSDRSARRENFSMALGGFVTPVMGMAAIALATAGCKRAGHDPIQHVARVVERRLSTLAVSPRLNHATAILPDGRVLVTGGWGLRQTGSQEANLDELRDAVIYEPARDRWVPAGNMARARLRHSATVMGDGRVLVVGGLNRDKSAALSAEVFDPETTTWRDASGFQNGRDGHRAVKLDDGTVLVVGGMTGYAGDPGRAEIFDPIAGQWLSAGSIPKPLYGLSLTVLRGRVLAAGGFGLTAGTSGDWPGVSGSSYLFSCGTREWTRAGRLNTARYGHTATRLDDGRVVVTGGWNKHSLSSVEVFAPTEGSWSNAGALVEARHTHTATLLPNGGLLVAGGQNGTDLQAGFYLAGTPVTTMEIYDPAGANSRWSGALRAPYYYHTASLLPDGKILLLGGLYERRVSNAQAYAELGYALVEF